MKLLPERAASLQAGNAYGLSVVEQLLTQQQQEIMKAWRHDWAWLFEAVERIELMPLDASKRV